MHTVCLPLNCVHFFPASIPLYYTHTYEENILHYLSYCFHTIQELGPWTELDIHVHASFYYLQTQAYKKLNRGNLIEFLANHDQSPNIH